MATLDQWLKEDIEKTMKETQREENEDELLELGDLSSLIKEFLEKIQIPEIKTLKKKVYEIHKILPVNKKGLIITEKAKVASAIARALGKWKRRKVRTKWGDVTVYDVIWSSRSLTIVPLRGHILEYTTSEEFSGKWEKSDPKNIIDVNALKEEVIDKHIAEVLKREIMTADLLILATDADEEGANIGLEVYELVSEIKKVPVVQMWFISLNPSELKKTFLKPIEPKWEWAYAVKARRILDAMIGFSATRELTVYFRDYLNQIGARVLSIGRVQTPTLYLLYLREKEIKKFKPKPYWSLNINLEKDGVTVVAKHANSPFNQEKIAYDVFNKIKYADKAIIEKISTEEKRILPPTPLNTTKILALLNKFLGIPSKKAMAILEDLYLSGLITYPRTETDKYPPDYNHLPNLKKLTSLSTIGVYAKKAIETGAKLIRNGSKLVGDHLPITPIDAAERNDSRLPTKLHEQVYEIIVRRYLALFYPPAVVEKKRVIFNVLGESFEANFQIIKVKGFMEVYPIDMPKDMKVIDFYKGETVFVKKVQPPQKKYTKPPTRISEGELIRLMERLALGTKSTRPEHIETLIKRRYAERKGRKLIVTEIGASLISFLEKIWSDFVKPLFSANVHILMRKVMNGELDWEEMIRIVQKEYLKLFDELRKNKECLKEQMNIAIKQDVLKSKVISCPKCGNSMVIRSTKKKKVNLLVCLNCKYSVIIPLARAYIPVGIKCPICGAETIILKRESRKIFLCPICWREYGPCYKCPELEKCPIKTAIDKEEEKTIVGRCECGGNLKYISHKKVVLYSNCGKRYYLPKKGRITLLKKVCDKDGLRVFSIRSSQSKYYFCIKCGEKKK